MPVVLGPARMKGGLLLLEVLSVLLITSALAAGMIPAGPALVTVPTIAFSMVLTATIGDGRDPRARWVAKDAEYLVLGAIGLIAL
jgi:4-hydroxybenzoate polyprenyltransferase